MTSHSSRRLTHCESVVGEGCSLLVLLVEFFFARDHELNVVQHLSYNVVQVHSFYSTENKNDKNLSTNGSYKWRKYDEEIAQVHVVTLAKLGRENFDQQLKVLGALRKVFTQIADDVIKLPECLQNRINQLK